MSPCSCHPCVCPTMASCMVILFINSHSPESKDPQPPNRVVVRFRQHIHGKLSSFGAAQHMLKVQRTMAPTLIIFPRLSLTALLSREGLGGLSYHLPQSPGSLALTCALGVAAGPGAVDGAVSAEQACGIVAFATLVDNGTGEHQTVAEHHSRIAWSSRVPTRDHWGSKREHHSPEPELSELQARIEP